MSAARRAGRRRAGPAAARPTTIPMGLHERRGRCRERGGGWGGAQSTLWAGGRGVPEGPPAPAGGALDGLRLKLPGGCERGRGRGQKRRARPKGLPRKAAPVAALRIGLEREAAAVAGPPCLGARGGGSGLRAAKRGGALGGASAGAPPPPGSLRCRQVGAFPFPKLARSVPLCPAFPPLLAAPFLPTGFSFACLLPLASVLLGVLWPGPAPVEAFLLPVSFP